MANLEMDGGIKIYLREIGKTALLTREEEESVVPETIVLEEGAPVESIFELEDDEVEEEQDDVVDAVGEGSAVENDDEEESEAKEDEEVGGSGPFYF